VDRIKLLAGLAAVTAAFVLASSAPASAATPTVTASPSTGLVNGQTVTLTGSGYEANHAIFVLECSSSAGASACDVSHLKPVTTSATGTFSTTFTVATGAIGDGTCNPGQSCIIAAGDASGVGGAANITFKAPATKTPTTSTTKTTTTTTTKTTTPAKTATKATTTNTSTGAGSAVPTTVSAGTGGAADRNGMPVYSLLLGAIGGAAVVGAGVQSRRR
jgi:hypothetical protein